jgi:uncharacterized cupredoxin-like copper-binding protein
MMRTGCKSERANARNLPRMARGRRGACWAAVAGLLTCCGGTSNPAGAIQVGLEDFKLHLGVNQAKSGEVTLHLVNSGPSTHEFNVDRTDLAPDQLPLRADGLSVDEASPLLKRLGSVEVLEAGDKKNLTLNLPPGHYVLYCNLEGHYLGSMHASLDVN